MFPMFKTDKLNNKFSFEKMLSRQFSQVLDVVIPVSLGGDNSFGSLAIINSEGETLVLKGSKLEDAELVSTPVSMSIPAFAVNTPIEKIKFGDVLVKNGRAIGFFIKKVDKEFNNTSLQFLNLKGQKSTQVVVRDEMLGTSILVVQSPFSKEGGMGSLAPLMMMELFSTGIDGEDGTDTSSFGKLIAMMTLMGNSNQGAAVGGDFFKNPLMLMMLLNRGGENEGMGTTDSFFKMALLSGMLGGNGLFGSTPLGTASMDSGKVSEASIKKMIGEVLKEELQKAAQPSAGEKNEK